MKIILKPSLINLSKLLILLLYASSTLSAQNFYEAEADINTLSGGSVELNCSQCSNGKKVGYIGKSADGFLTINGIQANAGVASVTIYYILDGTRTFNISVNGANGGAYTFTGDNWITPNTLSINVYLNSGLNSLTFNNNSAWGPEIDRIEVNSNVQSSWGLLSNGLRDKFQWPFASNSLWNTAIGSQANYQTAEIKKNNYNVWPTTFVQDENIIIMKPWAPLTNIYYNSIAWDGGDRCKAEGSVIATVPIPENYTLPNSGANNSAAILMPDGYNVAQNQPLTRCDAGGVVTTNNASATVNIYGTDPSGSHGGSGLSGLGGAIRLGEFTSGKIHHPMAINLFARQYYHCCNYHWPASKVDGYANPTTYGGTNPNLGPGSLLALLPDFDLNSLTTQPGKILAQAFIDYGAYLVDDTFWNAWAIITEAGPNGRVIDEFSNLYGYSMEPWDYEPFYGDMAKIFEALHIVTNNSANSIGGGGTPRQPLPPNIGN